MIPANGAGILNIVLIPQTHDTLAGNRVTWLIIGVRYSCTN